MEKESVGAPSALAWIQAQEADARHHYEHCKELYRRAVDEQIARPPAKDGIDFDAIANAARHALETAQDDVQKWQKILLSYEKGIPDQKRDTTERLSREENMSLLGLIIIYFRTAVEGLLTQFNAEVRTLTKAEEVSALMDAKIRDCFLSAVSDGVREKHLPTWVKDAVEDAL